jgi:TRAP transporter TAXI family solute receptor
MAAREIVTIWAPLALIVAAGFLVAYRYVGAPPPYVIRIAAGAENGAYHAFAQQYAHLLAGDGITLEVIPTAGTVDNLELLRRGEVSLALVQGGCAREADRADLQSLGSLFLEAVWVFTPRASPIRRLNELVGKRVAVGPSGSGTQLLAKQLLGANGVSESNATFVHIDTFDVTPLLVRGELDAGIVVASAEAFVSDSRDPRRRRAEPRTQCPAAGYAACCDRRESRGAARSSSGAHSCASRCGDARPSGWRPP